MRDKRLRAWAGSEAGIPDLSISGTRSAPPRGVAVWRRAALWMGLGACLWAASGVASAAGAPAVDFNRDVRPILAENCFACHGPDAGQRKAGLRLDLREGALATLAAGLAAVVPGRPDAGTLMRRVASRTMPPPGSNKRLTDAQIALLRRWIGQGASYSRHWSFVPPVRPQIPRVRNPRWPVNAIDSFVLARLGRERLQPSSAAGRATLIRRVSLDLTGLPPNPSEVDAFLSDRSANAYEKVVDRLLASPRYGERMAWEWLDAARYADTNGYQGDRTRIMWPWRDWVIDAFNQNMPFDRFTVEQIAGDLLPNATLAQKIATGFNRNHMLNGEGGRIPEESRVDYVVDRVDTTSTVWLGLTLGCARCHDHKFDPLAQRDYYRLFAYFNNLPETGSVDRGGNANPVLSLPTPEQSTQMSALQERIRTAESRLPAAPVADRPGLQKEIDEARKAVQDLEKSVLTTMVMEERPQPRDTFLLVRGAYDRPGEKVTPGVPASLPGPASDAPPNRLGLARWLVDPANPLTSRVAVNRYWQMLFGTGLVKTAEDFGIQGERPSHPELLDWLAVEYRALGWDTKALLRLMVTSATYRQSSDFGFPISDFGLKTSASESAIRNPRSAISKSAIRNLLSIDPENRLLARASRFRLPSAVLRDQALFVGGLLVEKVGGAPVKPYQPAGIWEDATFGQIKYEQDRGDKLYRRSLYTFWRRIVGPTTLFDTASRQSCTVRQSRTNTPLHALTLLNDITFVEAARAFAQRVMKEGGSTQEERIDFAFRLAAARRATGQERRTLLRSLARLRAHYAADPAAALKLLSIGESPRDQSLDPVQHAAFTGLCSLVLNLDEVLSKE